MYLKFVNINIPTDEENKLKQDIEKIYETIEEIIKIRGNKITFEAKEHGELPNNIKFVDKLSFNGGGCLELNTTDVNNYHR